MRRRYRIGSLTVALVMATGACGGDDATAPGGADEPATSTPAGPTPLATDAADGSDGGDAAGDGQLTTGTTDLGEVVVDGEGMTLYVFDNDTDGESSCYDSCAETWPPFTGDVSVAGDVDEALVGTTERTDGTPQVTYAGMPLYYYVQDQQPGDVTGQGVGGVWWVIDADGNKVTEQTSSAGY